MILDAGPIGILANPGKSQAILNCQAWVNALRLAGRRVLIPEIADYEVRRELMRLGRARNLARLDELGTRFEFLPISTPAMRLAAELWAAARRRGRPTAADASIDADVILSAQSLVLSLPVIVATANVSHISLFVPCDDWANIIP